MPVGIHTFTRKAAMLWRWARGELALRMTETVGGLPGDLISDTIRQVARWTMPLEDTPEDALKYLFRDYGMPAYVEPYAQSLARVKEFISVIPYAGAKVMLEAQAVYAGLTNPVVVPDLPNSEFNITADNAGFMPRWGDPGLQWGDPIVWGSYLEPTIAKNLRALLTFFRPARERYTGVMPTYWEPSLFAPYSWVDARHGTVVGSTFTEFADQGTIGGTHTVSGNPQEFDTLRPGSKTATMTADRIEHDGGAFKWKELNGQTDGFFWWAGTLDNADVGNLCGTGAASTTSIGFRLRWSLGSFVLSFSNGAAHILNKSDAGYPNGYYVVAVSIDSTLGTYGGVKVWINGKRVAALEGNFSDAPSNSNPAAALTIGAQPEGGNNYDGDWQSFGWVKGRPAIGPDVTLLLQYVKAEVGNDWDPQDDTIAINTVGLDWNPQDASLFTFSAGNSIASYTEPEEGVVFSQTGGGEPDLVAGEFEGKQSGIVALTGDDLTNTGDGDSYFGFDGCVWLWVARNNIGSNSGLLFTQAGVLAIYERDGSGNFAYHDGSSLRSDTVGPPSNKSYVAALKLKTGGSPTGQFWYGGFPLSVLTYDGSATFTTAALQFWGGPTVNLSLGRLVGYPGGLADDEIKQRLMALSVQYCIQTAGDAA